MAIVVCENVKKTYEVGKVLVPALRGVNLTINEGEFTAIAGPSGSGKSTLLNMIGALDVPTAGKVTVAGMDLRTKSATELSCLRRDRIGFVFQAYNLIPVLTAVENVEFILMIRGVSAGERRARSLAILKRVGLADMAHRRPNELSGGQQQRVAVARAIVSRPQLILADEPTANLDSKTSAGLIDLMLELNESEKMTFVFSSHDQLVMKRSHRLLILKDGQIVEDNQQNAA
ncbi:MAG: ABC transporter ATP-binding protein [Candidatus Lernaella stagnicola]|nr:ABC transporter ATP-binding protein [Candidatus Lernaella stagnicola]